MGSGLAWCLSPHPRFHGSAETAVVTRHRPRSGDWEGCVLAAAKRWMRGLCAVGVVGGPDPSGGACSQWPCDRPEEGTFDPSLSRPREPHFNTPRLVLSGCGACTWAGAWGVGTGRGREPSAIKTNWLVTTAGRTPWMALLTVFLIRGCEPGRRVVCGWVKRVASGQCWCKVWVRPRLRQTAKVILTGCPSQGKVGAMA